MKLPQFTAEASPGPTIGTYRSNAVFGRAGAGKVLPMLGYDCSSPPYCKCTGDDDCNNMFSSGVCGPDAICQINSANIPKCVCKTARSAPHAGETFITGGQTRMNTSLSSRRRR